MSLKSNNTSVVPASKEKSSPEKPRASTVKFPWPSLTETSNGGTDTISIVTNTDFANLAAANFDEIEKIKFAIYN